MAIEWRRRHRSDTGWLAFDGGFIRGQVAQYDEVKDPHERTGRHFYLGFVSGSAKAVTPRCFDPADARSGVEDALRRSSLRT